MQMLDVFSRNRRAIALAMLIGTSAWFVYSFAQLRGTVGVDPDLRPFHMVYLTAALSVQAAEATFRPRAPVLGIGMLVLSIILLILGSLSPS